MLIFVKGLTRFSYERQGMEAHDTQDKRQFRRMHHCEPVQYQFTDPNESGGCVAKDLSEGGLQIRLNHFVPLDTELILKIRLASENVLECSARVVWIEKSRFGENYQAGLEFLQDESVLNNQKQIYGFLSHQ